LDQDCNDCANSSRENMFFKKGFQGTEKSAFDILKDIFEENDDDYFFQNYDDFGISETLKSTMKSFIDDEIFFNEHDRSNNFCENYRPTFMDPDFFMAPPEFNDMDATNKCTTHLFSFLSTNSGDQSYSRTSTTVFHNGKVTTSVKDRFQNGKEVFEQEEASEYNQERHTNISDHKIYDSTYTAKPKDGSFIIIDEEVRNEFPFNGFKDKGLYNPYCFSELDSEFIKAEAKNKINSPSKKITKNKDTLNIRLVNKKPSKKSRN
jgi:hypothetical protein